MGPLMKFSSERRNVTIRRLCSTASSNEARRCDPNPPRRGNGRNRHKTRGPATRVRTRSRSIAQLSAKTALHFEDFITGRARVRAIVHDARVCRYARLCRLRARPRITPSALSPPIFAWRTLELNPRDCKPRSGLYDVNL